nr:hypothetical protein [Tanacetum cinerariifolium]
IYSKCILNLLGISPQSSSEAAGCHALPLPLSPPNAFSPRVFDDKYVHVPHHVEAHVCHDGAYSNSDSVCPHWRVSGRNRRHDAGRREENRAHRRDADFRHHVLRHHDRCRPLRPHRGQDSAGGRRRPAQSSYRHRHFGAGRQPRRPQSAPPQAAVAKRPADPGAAHGPVHGPHAAAHPIHDSFRPGHAHQLPAPGRAARPPQRPRRQCYDSGGHGVRGGHFHRHPGRHQDGRCHVANHRYADSQCPRSAFAHRHGYYQRAVHFLHEQRCLLLRHPAAR